MTWVLIIGLIMLAIALPIVGRRVLFLYRLITSGQPAPDRLREVRSKIGQAIRNQVVEVFGQRRLLKWTIPGAAHAMVFWSFVILGTVYVEAFGIMFSRNPKWAIPVIGHWDVLGFAQDTIALLCLVGIFLFWQIRLRNNPERLGRKSRFMGSHLGGAYLVLFMIFNVIWTMFFFRGAAAANDNLPYGWGAYASQGVGRLFDAMGLSHGTLEVMEGVGLLLHIGVMLAFLIEVVHSKHLHIFLAPINVLFKREEDGVALGALKPLTVKGEPVTLDDIEDMDEDTTLGVGSIEDFSWKGLLDMATCTECGRCQSQCPAWNTEKPLSPKLLIMNLRDHAMGAGDYLLAGEDKSKVSATALAEAERPLVGETEGDPAEPTGGGVIDPDVLWSCVSCGACVQQCPVDIEHVDHIVDMRRYQVLVESNFPSELNQLFKGMESKGNPWNMSPNMRMDWAKGLDFEVPVVGEDLESLESVDWLFWVGCAGAYEDRAMKTTRAVAELLNIADVSFGVLGKGETCTGDSARRAGNEFVFQGLAQENVETFKEYKVKKVVSTCAHCFNTLKNEYKEFGIELEVVHHTQLLNRLVREGRLTPVSDGAGAAKRSITYHDPCYIGRHNQVYEPPRELLTVLPGAELVEMERNSERSFCCGAGGARMWMEETIGERINVNRTTEAVGTGADQIAVGCPFCRVMLSDGLTALQDSGEAREEVEVLDVAQMLLASVKGVPATRDRAKSGAAGASAKSKPAESKPAESAPVDRESAPVDGESARVDGTAAGATAAGAGTAAGGSLFDVGSDDSTPSEEAGTTSSSSSGGSLFDLGSEESASDAPEAEASPSQTTESGAEDLGSGGSLFDLGGDEQGSSTNAKAEPAEPAAKPAETENGQELGSSGSLFDVAADEPATSTPTEAKETQPAEESPSTPEPTPTPAADTTSASNAAPGSEIPEGGSLFDIEAPAEPAAAAPAAPVEESPVAEAPAEESKATEEPAAAESEEPATESGPSESAAPAKPAQAAAVGSEIPEGGSLFDIETPAQPQPTATAAVVPDEATERDTDTADVAEPEQTESETTGSAATAEATDFGTTETGSTVTDRGENEAPTEAVDPERVSQAATEAAQDEEPASTSADSPSTSADSGETSADSGRKHQPRTDVDINESGSLFDL